MKRLILFLALLLVSVNFAQERRVIFADTVDNSKAKEFNLSLRGVHQTDSVVISISAYGEIDLDSLNIEAGPNVWIYRLGDRVQHVDYEYLAGVTLSINLAEDVFGYEQAVITLKGATLKGYDAYKFTLTAGASGNDPTDTNQVAVVVARIYKPYEYNIEEK